VARRLEAVTEAMGVHIKYYKFQYRVYCKTNFSFIAIFSLLSWSRLMRSLSYLCIPHPHQFLNAWTSLYETCYVYRGKCAHLSDVFNKSLLSVCVSVYVSPLPWLVKGSVKCMPPFITMQWLTSFSVCSMSYQRRVCGSVCISPYLCWVTTW
jgi:hypothetical protein